MRLAPSEPSSTAAPRKNDAPKSLTEDGPEAGRGEELTRGDAAALTEAPRQENVIVPTRGWRALRLGEIWDRRELLYFLVWRNVKGRYKQTALGITWVVIQPLALMLLFTALFRTLIHVPHDGTPYPLFVFAGLASWQLVAAGLSQASVSLVINQQLITKTYFPRLLIPIASIISSLVDVVVAFLVLIVAILAYGLTPEVTWLALPVFLVLGAAAALGAALWLSALNVRYRDVQTAMPFLLQFWFFATPIIYSVLLIPSQWRLFLALNPLTGVVYGVRWSLFRDVPLSLSIVGVSAAISILLLVTGALYFRRVERTFVDLV
jgi:lipopolysaccharide transport system permease protein